MLKLAGIDPFSLLYARLRARVWGKTAVPFGKDPLQQQQNNQQDTLRAFFFHDSNAYMTVFWMAKDSMPQATIKDQNTGRFCAHASVLFGTCAACIVQAASGAELRLLFMADSSYSTHIG